MIRSDRAGHWANRSAGKADEGKQINLHELFDCVLLHHRRQPVIGPTANLDMDAYRWAVVEMIGEGIHGRSLRKIKHHRINTDHRVGRTKFRQMLHNAHRIRTISKENIGTRGRQRMNNRHANAAPPPMTRV